MPYAKTKRYAVMLLLALAGCASQAPVLQPVAVTCPRPPPPPAWTLRPPSNSLLLLDKTFSTSAPGSSLTSTP